MKCSVLELLVWIHFSRVSSGVLLLFSRCVVVRLSKQLLNFGVVACRGTHQEIGPVNAPNKSDERHSSQKLEQAYHQLRFVDVGISQNRSQHGADAWKD